MEYFKKIISIVLIYILLLFPALTILPLLFLSPKTLTGPQGIDASFVWSLVGNFLGYYGFLFSLYAALEIRKLSNKYFFKIRSPQIQRRISVIVKSFEKYSSENGALIQSQTFFCQIPVVLRSAQRMRNNEIKTVAVDAERLFISLRENAIAAGRGVTAANLEGYWGLFGKLSELVDEIKSQIEDMEAT